MVTIVINNCNLVTWPKAMVERIQTFKGAGEIIIVDNASTYPPVHEWYNQICKSKNNIRIKLLTENVGHKAPWLPEILQAIKTDWYVVTDPDLDLSITPDDCLLHLKYLFNKYNALGKVGLALKADDIPKESPSYDHIQRSDLPVWNNWAFNNELVGYPVDTTFAIYHKSRLIQHCLCGARTDQRYAARHLPWYVVKPDAEFQYYLDHAHSSSSYKMAFVK